ncbi:MAG: SHOCT domain-containing protein [Paraclostridium sp.]
MLKGLKRLKVILGDNSDTDDFDKTTSINTSEKSIPEQIKEYKDLLDIDAITKEEFEMKKKELLNK